MGRLYNLMYLDKEDHTTKLGGWMEANNETKNDTRYW